MRNLRRDAGKANRRAMQDLEKLQKALRQSPTTRRSTSRSTGRKTTTRARSSSRSSSGGRRSTGARKR